MKIQLLKTRIIYLLLVALWSLPAAGQSLENLRYFMQHGVGRSDAVPYGNNPSAGHYVQSGDAKIYYEVYGKGKPIVVLHGGIVGSPLEMGQFIDSLSRKYQVIAVSTRGHGRSEMGSVVPSYEQKAKDVNAIIRSLTREKVTVLGFSDGAYTGYFFAKTYPDKTDKLIAIGAGEWKKGFRDFNFTSESAFAMDESYWKQQLHLRPEPQRFEEWFNTIGKYYNSVDLGQELFKNIGSPVLVMAGEKDQNAPLKTVIDAYFMLPHAQLSIIPNAPHPAFLVNFPAVWTSIIPFLNE